MEKYNVLYCLDHMTSRFSRVYHVFPRVPPGMWQYSSLGGEGGGGGGPSTSGAHASANAHAGGAAGPGGNAQPELTDMLQILDPSGAANFDDLNIFNTNYE